MKNILIVDDERIIRKLLSRCLEDNNYGIWVAEDAQQARNILNSQSIDLLITDINMPGESGIDLARYVKSEYPDVAIIIMSIIDNPESAKEAFELGVYGYIVKPFTLNIVLISVENALRRQQLELQNKSYQKEIENRVRQLTGKSNKQVVFLQNLIDTIPSAIFYVNKNGILLGCNKVFEQFVGRSKATLLSKAVSEVFPANLADFYQKVIGQSHGSRGQECQIEMQDANSQWRTMLVNFTIRQDEKGDFEGMVGALLDITERIEMSLAVRSSEEMYQQVVENIDIGVAIINPQMEIIRMNPQMRKWFPSIEPGTGALCYQSLQNQPRELPCDDCPALKTFAKGESFEKLLRVKGEQRERCFRDHSVPIHDALGNVVSVVLLVEDVTEKLVFERELRQAQKLEAIGQLAAGVAHEINSPIQYVGDNIRFLQDGFKNLSATLFVYDELLQAVKKQSVTDGMLHDVDRCISETDLMYLQEEIPRAIEQSLEGVERVSQIVRAMRDFSHPGTDQKTMTDLNQAINNTVTVSRNEWKYVAEMELNLDPTLPEVPCFPGEINQVLLNVIVNAAHAIAEVFDHTNKDKGKISIATRRENDSIMIFISDTGPGIPIAFQHRIFDPFFTTKVVGQGTGQGLAIAHRVITDKHGGSFRFETQENEGTTFIIELPLQSDREESV